MRGPLTPDYATPTPRARRRTSWAGVVVFAAIHFVMFFVLLMLSFSSAMADFDPGTPGARRKSPAIEAAFRVVSLPLFPLLVRAGPRAVAFQWPILAANSLIWGYAMSLSAERLRRAVERRG